uniref:Putative zinc finger protein JACKDAW-like n=1 Tax=Davidia involucrata TaxID=16924 RepID=A0A5B6Z420_DAVIN
MMSDGLSSIPSTMIRGFIQDPNPNPNPNTNPVMKRKRNQPGTPDPDAEVIGLSPKSLMATNRFLCEICNKGFQRDQNLQLHRRGHNLPWKLKQRTSKEVRKKVYICPEKSCVHHDPSRALGDLTGIKKHYSRKHGEKKWKCEKCSKKYAVQSDWKAHSKICGTREYKCDCGTLFSRKDSFITHRAFCDALAEESARFSATSVPPLTNLNLRNDLMSTAGTLITDPPHQAAAGNPQFSAVVFRGPDDIVGGLEGGQRQQQPHTVDGQKPRLPLWLDLDHVGNNYSHLHNNHVVLGMAAAGNSNAYLVSSSTDAAAGVLPDDELVQTAPTNVMSSSQWLINKAGQESSYSSTTLSSISSLALLKVETEENKANLYYNNQLQEAAPAHMSATALLQKAAQMGSTKSSFGSGGSFSAAVCSFNSFNQNRNEVIHKFAARQAHENLNELIMMSSISPATNNIGDAGSMLLGDMNSSSSLVLGNNTTVGRNNMKSLPLMMMMMMPTNANQSKPSCTTHYEVERSMTRDFLGVGDGGGTDDGGRPLLQQELAKFASIGSAMDLSQYTGSH